MQLLAPFAALSLLAVPAILALYFLKVRRPQMPVSSLLFWRQQIEDRQANAPWQRLRTSLLLLLQLLVALALAFALMRPGFAQPPSVASTKIVLLDGSPSMLATDVKPDRFSVAVDAAKGMTREVGGAREMALVLLGDHARLLVPPTSDKAKLQRALDQVRPPAQRANLGEGISVANSLLAGRPGGEVVLVSDGHFELASPAPKVAGPLRYASVGATGDNLGIESFTRQADGVVSVRLANLGRDRRDVQLELRADGELVDVLPVGVDGNESTEMDWPGLAKGTTVLEARVTPGDTFALDDTAWLVTEEAAPRKVLLVTAGNGFLQRALALRGDLEVTVVKPAEYVPGKYDLSVFDGFVPPGELPQPALVIAPPKGQGPLPADEVTNPGELLPADPRDPLLRYVSLKDVHVQAAARVAPLPGWRSVIAASGGPLVLVTRDEPRLAQITFDIHNSDLPLRPAFPVLVQNLVTHLLGGSFANQTFPVGQPVRLVAEPGAQALEVKGPDGFRTTTLKPPFPATLEDTTRPGVYTVRQVGLGDELTRRFVLHLDVPEQSRIAPGAGPAMETGPGRPGQAPPSTSELWPWLAAVALAVVAVEWLVFLRR
ncbi:MAG: BatA and WFA domain-containing protein [Acidimicrobiales bacterium]